MRVEHESGFTAEIKDEWTYGDQKAIRRASRVGNVIDDDVGETAMVLRAVQSWSAGPVTEEVADTLPGQIATWLIGKILGVVEKDPKVAWTKSISIEPHETAA